MAEGIVPTLGVAFADEIFSTAVKHIVDPAVDNIVNASNKKAAGKISAEHVFSLAEELIRQCPEGHVFNGVSAQWLLHVRELVREWSSVEGAKERFNIIGHNIDVLELTNLHGRARTPGKLTEQGTISSWNKHRIGSTSAKVIRDAEMLVTHYRKDLNNGKKVYVPVEASRQFECPRMPEYMDFECRSETMDRIISSIHNHQFTQIYGPAGIGKTTMLVQIVKQIGYKFNGVVHVQVSRSPEILKIQQEIADKLAVSLDGNRADRLREGIERIGGKVLIVLDDVWAGLNLERIGIPTGENVKVIIGTRMSNLSLNNDDNKISVGFLTKEDSWLLFQQVAGLRGSEPPSGTKSNVKRQCFGLPLALAVIGNTLSGEQDSAWKNALDSLKEPKIKALSKPISGNGTEYLCQVIEYSYKHLYTNKIDMLDENQIDVAKADNIARHIFRLCSLFPENDAIPQEDLKKYLIAEDPKLESKHFDSAILRLLECHLLKPTADRGILQMHPVVRDAAVYLAEKEDDAVIHCGTKTELSEEIVTSNGTVSVMGCNITKTVGFKHTNFLERKFWKSMFRKAKCAPVHTLLLRKNYTLPETGLPQPPKKKETELPDLPPSFFERMQDLTVLDLSHSEIKILPPSMRKLQKVKTLLLSGCKKLEKVKHIVSLKKLLVLSLRETALTSLPTGMSNLVGLIVLELTPAKGCVIPQGFFTALPGLQELFLATESLTNSVVMEIIELREMKSLRLYVNKTILDFPAFDVLKPWPEFTIYSDLTLAPMSLKKNLHIKDLDTANTGVKSLLKAAEHLFIENCFTQMPQGIHSDLAAVTGVSEFTETEILHLKDCAKIQHLSSDGSSGWGNLQVLELTGLKEFTEIFESTVSAGSFAIVREITYRTCDTIIHVMPTNLVQKVHARLQKIRVISCGNVRYIFDSYSGLFDVLTFIEVQGLNILENIWNVEPPSGTFANLMELIVTDCDKLVFVFTPSLAAMLTSLQKLIVERNKTLKEIVHCDGINALDMNVFQKVTHVSIQKLENLQHFHGNPENGDLVWPSLVQLRLGGCDALTKFPIGQASAPYMTRIDVTSEIDKQWPWYKQLETTAERFKLRVAYDPTAEDE